MKHIYRLTSKGRAAVVIALNIKDARRVMQLNAHGWSDARVLHIGVAPEGSICRVLAPEET